MIGPFQAVRILDRLDHGDASHEQPQRQGCRANHSPHPRPRGRPPAAAARHLHCTHCGVRLDAEGTGIRLGVRRRPRCPHCGGVLVVPPAKANVTNE